MLEHILIWARGATLDNAYSRDRVVFRLLQQSGIRLSTFSPSISAIGDIEAMLRRAPLVDAVWVPSFRQRDVAAAARFARRRVIPLIFDPLISAYDKQVNERGKFSADSAAARWLLKRERNRFDRADILIADTQGHADYFAEQLAVPRERIVLLPVGADESIFTPQPPRLPSTLARLRVLFYGSFIGLHGVPTIVDAIRRYGGPPVEFHFVGDGPMRADAERALAPYARDGGTVSVRFEPWLDSAALTARIGAADIVLGVFGTSGKALRVVPNKVYQALAVGRPVITADTPAFDCRFRAADPAPLAFTAPGDGTALAHRIAAWVDDRSCLPERARAARQLFETQFSESHLRRHLVRELEARAPWEGRR